MAHGEAIMAEAYFCCCLKQVLLSNLSSVQSKCLKRISLEYNKTPHIRTLDLLK